MFDYSILRDFHHFNHSIFCFKGFVHQFATYNIFHVALYGIMPNKIIHKNFSNSMKCVLKCVSCGTWYIQWLLAILDKFFFAQFFARLHNVCKFFFAVWSFDLFDRFDNFFGGLILARFGHWIQNFEVSSFHSRTSFLSLLFIADFHAFINVINNQWFL